MPEANIFKLLSSLQWPHMKIRFNCVFESEPASWLMALKTYTTPRYWNYLILCWYALANGKIWIPFNQGMDHRIYLFGHVRACIENIWNICMRVHKAHTFPYSLHTKIHVIFVSMETQPYHLTFHTPHHRYVEFHLKDFFFFFGKYSSWTNLIRNLLTMLNA